MCKKKYCISDTNKLQSISIICNSIMFTIILYSSLVQFPSMEKNKEAWAIYVERTFFGFILFAVGEILSDVYLVCNLKREAEFDYQVRFIGLCALFLGWLVTLSFVLPLQLELAYDKWSTDAYNSIVIWNWLRTGIWGMRFSMIGFYSLFEIREEEPMPPPPKKGYMIPVDQNPEVFTFEDAEE